ncbi:MAG: patatin-like phospholipase family protein [Deltaproteobacteria bacterium]|nr:patatin-like phospholipase family protein [Deltaproteobacteria bacterium]
MAKKIGIALGSGSARGWSHIGVIRSLIAAEIPVEIVCGASVGALVAGSFAAGFLDPLDRWARRLNWSHLIGFMDMAIPRSGLVEGEKISSYLREVLSDPMIENLPVPFAAVATDLKTGKEVWIREGSLIDAVRASISLPGIFTPFGRNGQWLVDGGLVNPVPVSLCRMMGAEIVIAVNLNSDIMRKPRLRQMADPPVNGNGVSPRAQGRWAAFLSRTAQQGNLTLFRQLFQEQPGPGPTLFDVMATSVKIMQDAITRQRLLDDPPDILVRPKLADIGLMEFNRAGEAIEEGTRAMDLLIPMLRDLMD